MKFTSFKIVKIYMMIKLKFKQYILELNFYFATIISVRSTLLF
jgi:hypothetical protein